MTRVAEPPPSRAAAGAIAAAPGRRPRWRRVVRSVAVGAAVAWLGVLAGAAPAAQASQRPAGAAAALTTYPYTFSRIAWTGADEVIAATDKHGDLYYFWQASGTTTWHKQLVARGGSGFAYSKPSIAWTGHAVAIAAVDASGDLVYFAKTPSTTTWSYTLLATASSGKFQAPAVTAAANGTVLISAGNTDGQLESFTLAPGAASWAEQTVAAGLFGPSSVTADGDLLFITAASGGTLYFWWGGSPSWNEETVASPGAGGSYTGGSVAASLSYVLVTAATTTGAVDFFVQPFGGTSWTPQTVTSTGGPYASPQIAWTGPVNGTTNSYDVITAATRAGTLDYWWAGDGGGSWNPETVAAHGTTALYTGPGLAITSSSVVITAINTKPGNVMAWYQPFGTNPWNQQVVAKG